MATGSSRLYTEEVIEILDEPTMEGRDVDLDLDVGSDNERYMGTWVAIHTVDDTSQQPQNAFHNGQRDAHSNQSESWEKCMGVTA